MSHLGDNNAPKDQRGGGETTLPAVSISLASLHTAMSFFCHRDRSALPLFRRLQSYPCAGMSSAKAANGPEHWDISQKRTDEVDSTVTVKIQTSVTRDEEEML